MVLILPSILAFVWGILTAYIFLQNRGALIRPKVDLARYLGYNLLSSQAREAGWNITSKEFWGIVIFAVAVGLILALIFMNPLIIVAGILGGYYLPRFIIRKYKKRQRMSLMVSIPDFGRVLIARLLDHHSIVRAFEMAANDISGPMKIPAQEFVQDAGVGIGVGPALENLKVKIAFRKFNTFAETLLIAHREGYSNEALRAMEKAVEAVENDVKAIETLHLMTRKKKRELVYVVLAAWAFPVVLSFMNTGNVNIYLDTLPGKALMFSYIVSTLFVLIKGEDYLGLKLEEL